MGIFFFSRDTYNSDKTLSVVEDSTMEIADSRFVKLHPDDTFAEITFKNGKKRKVEFYYGDTYFSQSARRLKVDKNMSKVLIFNGKGASREIK